MFDSDTIPHVEQVVVVVIQHILSKLCVPDIKNCHILSLGGTVLGFFSVWKATEILNHSAQF